MFKQTGFPFGSLLVHADVDKPLLEITVPFINFLSDPAADIRQVKEIVFNAEKTALFEKRNGTADTGLADAEPFRDVDRSYSTLLPLDYQYRFKVVFTGCVQFHTVLSFLKNLRSGIRPSIRRPAYARQQSGGKVRLRLQARREYPAERSDRDRRRRYSRHCARS